ncbi:hypothetical protein ABIA69_001150 [Lysinibacillus parviboronicapiens]|uniref:Uncharacterized protein n=1 Tax=Lysinibacillus parviboronicapiens TaxID=436516 RepID=A0ABV2PGD2_9BACI
MEKAEKLEASLLFYVLYGCVLLGSIRQFNGSIHDFERSIRQFDGGDYNTSIRHFDTAICLP